MTDRIAKNIYELIYDRGMSLEEFAKQLAYSKEDVYRILTGELMLPPVELERIAKVLGVEKKDLCRKN